MKISTMKPRQRLLQPGAGSELCEKADDYIEIRLDMLGDYLKEHNVEGAGGIFRASR